MRDIPGYEGLYAATSCGKVYSYRAKKFLKPTKNKDGYLRVGLCKDKKRKWYYIHRLIAEVYLPNPENLLFVNHKDEDKSNNCVNNLEWISHKDNCNFGTRNERIAKACRKKVICLETNEIFNSVTEAAKSVNIDQSSISNCLAGRYKTSASYHWRYYEDEE